ncbi:MAG: TonB-dependent receptor plug domain-containing protein, partial [Candidatus Binatia bacterium]
MRAKGIALGALLCALESTTVGAEPIALAPATEITMDRTVISPTGWESRIAETSPSITIITGEELERKQVTTVADALREVPGVVVSEGGSRGATTSVFLRGSDSDQVLVLVNGIEVNSTTAGFFDFSNLTPENIERIEVLRGWGGTLYGSEAIGGVIQIFTRRGEGPPRGSISAAGGNAYTDREVAEVSGRSGVFSYSAGASHIRTEGFKPENDDYENTVVSGRIDADAAKDATAGVVFRVGSAEFGNFFSNNFLAAPDPNARQESGFAAGRGEWTHRPLRGVEYRLAVSYTRDDLEFRDPPDGAETGSTDSDFLAEVLSGDAQTNLSWWSDRMQSIFGIEVEERSGDVDSVFADPVFGEFSTAFDESVGTVSGYTLQQLFLDERRLVLTGGMRYDDNDRFGEELSPSGGASYALRATATRFRATYAEGFKAPSLNELFFPGFGNPDLDAETSREVTVGFDQPFAVNRALVSASWFHREVEDLIQGVPQDDGTLLAENVGEATIEGVEAALDVDLVAGLRVGGQYTFLDVDAEPSGRVRRPKHGGSVYVVAERDGLWVDGD